MPTKQNKSLTVIDKLQSDSMKSSLMAVMPKFMDYNRFMQIAISQAKGKLKEIRNLDPNSILVAAYQAATMGLSFDENRGEAYMVPYNCNVGTKKDPKWVTLVKFMPGYQGLIKLCRNSGMQKITVRIVYDADDFRFYTDEEGDHLEHSPSFDKDRGEPRLGYSIAIYEDGTKDYFTMPYHKILEAKNAAKTKSVWNSHEEEMAIKTVIRRHCKYLPKDDILSHATKLDEEMELGHDKHEIPDELLDTGVIDAEYQEVTEKINKEEEEESKSTKPEVSMPKPKKQNNEAEAKKQKSAEKGSKKKTESFAEAVGALGISEKDVNAVIFSEYGYETVNNVPEEEQEDVLNTLKEVVENA